MADEVKIEISAVDKTAAAVASVKRSLSGIEQSASKIQTAFKGLETGMGNAMRNFTTGLGQGAGQGAFNLLASLPGQIAAAGGAAMQSYAQFERLSMSINSLTAKEALQTGQANSMAQAMSQTAGKAKELQGWVEKLAIDSPFESADIANTFKLAMGMGFLSKEAQRVTKDLLDYASATGAESDKMIQLVSAMGKVKTTGKITGETLQQLGEAGLNATQILADAFGQTPKQIAEDISKGKVDADAALNAILASVEKFYGGAAKAQANSFSGILSSFEEIKNNTLRDFFAPAFQSLQPYMAELTGALSSPEFKAVTEKLGTMFGAGVVGTMTTIVTGAQNIAIAIQPLLDAETPAWMTILAALFQVGGGKPVIGVTVNPEVDPASGFTYDIGSGQFTFDAKGNLQKVDLKGFFGESTTTHWDPAAGLSIDMHGNFLGIPNLVEGINKQLDEANASINGVLDISAQWAAGTIQGLWTQIQAFFTSNPFNLFTTVSSGTAAAYDTPYGSQMRDRNNLVNEMMPPSSGLGYRAKGGPIQGWAMVGEQGPELAYFGSNGGHVVSNPDTRKLMGIPGYAGGSVEFGGALRGLISTIASTLGIKGQSGPTYGPAAERGWIDFTKKGEKAMQDVAESATKAFEVSAKKVAETFKSALGSVPGLNGSLSQVTDLDMQKAKAGMKVNYADDYIRQLSDEVLNGKEWGANVDIKDAAKRAGIDPNLPNELILELVKQAWADKSFFANPANLELINKDAVQGDMEQKQKEARGSANLLGFFGLDNTAEATQAAALGQAIQGAFGAIPVEILSSTGQTMMLHLSAGFTDPTTNVTAITNMGGALVTAMGTEAGAAAIKVSGVTLADAQYAAYATRMGQLPPVPPTGTTTPPPGGTTTPPGKAIGASNYAGGWTRVHKDETIYLPQGSNIYTAAESKQMGGAGAQLIQVTVASALDEEAVANRIMQKIRRRMN